MRLGCIKLMVLSKVVAFLFISDLNIIENIWSMIKCVLSKENLTTVDGIKAAMWRILSRITPQYLRTLYDSLPLRMAAFIKSKSEPITYYVDLEKKIEKQYLCSKINRMTPSQCKPCFFIESRSICFLLLI